MFVVLSLLFCSTLASHAYSQSVTLWEFGTGRLLNGVTTLPLLPIGVASGGLATTYLYRVVVTSGASATRTVIVSASGWFESFSANNGGLGIQCSFTGIGASEGVCFDQTSTASGPPTPHVIALEVLTTSSSSQQGTSTTAVPLPQATFPPMLTTGPVSASSILATSTSTTFPATTNTGTTLPVGAIAGATIGGVVIICSFVALLWWWHRRRSPHCETALPYPISESAPSDAPHSDACNSDISSSYMMGEKASLSMNSNAEMGYMRWHHITDVVTELLDRVRRLENMINSSHPS